MSGARQGAALRHDERAYELLVVGGGLAGIAAAVTAAREGARVALVQDRPVLGGNSSTEVRVNLEGANGGWHNRFFVESGLPEDLLLLNFWRNPTGSADHWGALLLDLVLAEPGLDLYLDTVARAVEIGDDGRIAAVVAHALGAEREWRLYADVVVDATGDGTIGHLAGAETMYGEEARERFDEPLAPDLATPLTLGGTMQFMCVDAGRPVHFDPPAFARRVTADELRTNRLPNVWQQAPVLGGFWWIEYGGDLHVVHDNQEIKLALLAEVYGVWDYVKNSPDLRERNRNLDLVWVSAVPGKRESRRIVGGHVLSEHDVMECRKHPDAVAMGGWSIDWHPPRGFLDVDLPPATQVHPPAPYQIPLRSLYARDVPNLWLAGRVLSASHVAQCSARVMLTLGHAGEAVGVAAALGVRMGRDPAHLVADAAAVSDVRRRLERRGHHIPYMPLEVDRPPAGTIVTASSVARLEHLATGHPVALDRPRLLSLPVTGDRVDSLAVWVQNERAFGLDVRVWASRTDGAWLPGEELRRTRLDVGPAPEGRWVDLPLGIQGVAPGYLHLGLAGDDPGVQLGASLERPLGPLSWQSAAGDLDALPVDRRREQRWALDQQTEEYGDSWAFVHSYWRRDGHGWGGWPGSAIAFRVTPEQPVAPVAAVLEPWERPTPDGGVHAWVGAIVPGEARDAGFRFATPEWLELRWEEPRQVEEVELYLNSDLERHLANLWYSHPPGQRAMTTLVSELELLVLAAGGWRSAGRAEGNWQRRRAFAIGATIAGIRVVCEATHGERYASIADVRVR